MPITLPTPPTPSGLAGSMPDIQAILRTRIFRPLDFSSSARSKAASLTVVLRAVFNVVHFVLYGYSRRPLWAFLPVLDQLVIMYAVSFLADARGPRRVFGVAVGERFFEVFLAACAGLHVLYMAVLILCIVSYAIFFGITGGFAMTVVGVLILPVAWLASRPEDGEGGLSLP